MPLQHKYTHREKLNNHQPTVRFLTSFWVNEFTYSCKSVLVYGNMYFNFVAAKQLNFSFTVNFVLISFIRNKSIYLQPINLSTGNMLLV